MNKLFKAHRFDAWSLPSLEKDIKFTGIAEFGNKINAVKLANKHISRIGHFGLKTNIHILRTYNSKTKQQEYLVNVTLQGPGRYCSCKHEAPDLMIALDSALKEAVCDVLDPKLKKWHNLSHDT